MCPTRSRSSNAARAIAPVVRPSCRVERGARKRSKACDENAQPVAHQCSSNAATVSARTVAHPPVGDGCLGLLDLGADCRIGTKTCFQSSHRHRPHPLDLLFAAAGLEVTDVFIAGAVGKNLLPQRIDAIPRQCRVRNHGRKPVLRSRGQDMERGIVFSGGRRVLA